MPHIHNEPDQHDITISAYVVLREDGEWKCLVHFHKKMDMLMQVGGHIELNETPWQAVAHELAEESGYGLDELEVLQYTADQVADGSSLLHPVPFAMNTHNVGNRHYHSDLCYGFVAAHHPSNPTAEGESNDVRWLTLDEFARAVNEGEALEDCLRIYEFLLDHLAMYARVPATAYSLDKPQDSVVEYKRGAPGSG